MGTIPTPPDCTVVLRWDMYTISTVINNQRCSDCSCSTVHSLLECVELGLDVQVIALQPHIKALHEKQVQLEGGGHIVPRIYSGPEGGSARDYMILPSHHSSRKKNARSSGTLGINIKVALRRWNLLTSEKCLQSDADVADVFLQNR